MKARLTPEQFVNTARALPVDERVPYAFEKRIMARIWDLAVVDPISLWAHALWRASAPCLAIMALALALSWPHLGDAARPEVETVDLETVVFEPTQLAFDVSR